MAEPIITIARAARECGLRYHVLLRLIHERHPERPRRRHSAMQALGCPGLHRRDRLSGLTRTLHFVRRSSPVRRFAGSVTVAVNVCREGSLDARRSLGRGGCGGAVRPGDPD